MCRLAAFGRQDGHYGWPGLGDERLVRVKVFPIW